MDKKETIKKCIEIAVENGWKKDLLNQIEEVELEDVGETVNIVYYGSNNHEYNWRKDWIRLIMSHDFAKALFGENETWYDPNRDDVEVMNEGWQCHLQQLATAENRIDCLKDYLSNNK